MFRHFLVFWENDRVQLTLACLLIFASAEEVYLAFEGDWQFKLAHGVLILYLNLFLNALARLVKASHTPAARDAA